MLTTSSSVFRCTNDQARFVAECANLKMDLDSSRGNSTYDMWQDRQTGGGGARIVWKDGVAWVTRHSGYAWADITEEVCLLFQEVGCEPLEGITQKNPSFFFNL